MDWNRIEGNWKQFKGLLAIRRLGALARTGTSRGATKARLVPRTNIH
jgi:hypothetical protein